GEGGGGDRHLRIEGTQAARPRLAGDQRPEAVAEEGGRLLVERLQAVDSGVRVSEGFGRRCPGSLDLQLGHAAFETSAFARRSPRTCAVVSGKLRSWMAKPFAALRLPWSAATAWLPTGATPSPRSPGRAFGICRAAGARARRCRWPHALREVREEFGLGLSPERIHWRRRYPGVLHAQSPTWLL